MQGDYLVQLYDQLRDILHPIQNIKENQLEQKIKYDTQTQSNQAAKSAYKSYW